MRRHQIEEEYRQVSFHSSNLEKEREDLKKNLASRVLQLQKTRLELKDTKARINQLHSEKAMVACEANDHIENLEQSILAQRHHFKNILKELKKELLSLCSSHFDVGSKL